MITLADYIKGQSLPANLTANANNSVWLANAVLAQYPNFVFTSGYRSPVKNSSVGGVNNSYHLTAQAFDLSGARLSAAQLAGLRDFVSGFNYEIIDEQNHYHFEPKNRNGFVAETGNPLPKPANNNNTLYYALGGLIVLLLLTD